MEETKRVTGKKGFSLRDMVLCALFAAILAVSAWLTVPGEVPFTLQTFGVFAALGLLGGKRGTIAIALYLVLGVCRYFPDSGAASASSWVPQVGTSLAFCCPACSTGR